MSYTKRFSAPVAVGSCSLPKKDCGPETIVDEKVYTECRPVTQCREVKEIKTVQKGAFECQEVEAPACAPVCEKKVEECDPCGKKKKRKGWQGFLLWLIISLIIGIILYFTRPPLVTNYDEVNGNACINWWALVIASLVFSAIVLGIIWLIAFLVGKKKQY